MSSALVLTATQRALPFTRMKDMHVLIHPLWHFNSSQFQPSAGCHDFYDPFPLHVVNSFTHNSAKTVKNEA